MRSYNIVNDQNDGDGTMTHTRNTYHDCATGTMTLLNEWITEGIEFASHLAERP